MTQITDWKGNEIKEGMEIAVIRFNTKSYFRMSGFPEPEVKDCWDIGEYYKVELMNGILVTRHISKIGQDGETYTFNFANPVSMLSWTGGNTIVAIKGVSDNEQEYRDPMLSL